MRVYVNACVYVHGCVSVSVCLRICVFLGVRRCRCRCVCPWGCAGKAYAAHPCEQLFAVARFDGAVEIHGAGMHAHEILIHTAQAGISALAWYVGVELGVKVQVA